MMRPRRSFSPEFKLDSARLVPDQGYSVSEASRSLGVAETALWRRIKQLEFERKATALLMSDEMNHAHR